MRRLASGALLLAALTAPAAAQDDTQHGAFGRAVRAAEKAGDLARFKGTLRCFLDAKDHLIETRVLRGDGGCLELAVGRTDPQAIRVRTSSASFGPAGELREQAVSRLVLGLTRPQLVRQVSHQGAAVVARDVGVKAVRERPWTPGALTFDQALFVLPRLAERLPARLDLHLVREGEPLAGAVTVTVAGGSGKPWTVTLTHPKLGTAVVRVADAGDHAITELTGFDHRVYQAVSQAVATKRVQAAIQGPLKARRAADLRDRREQTAVSALRAIRRAQELYWQHGGRGKRSYAPDLQALVQAKLLPPDLAKRDHGGYRFELTRSSKGTNFVLTASPLEPGKSGRRYFGITSQGLVHQALKPIPHRDDCTLPGAVWLTRQIPGAPKPTPPSTPIEGEIRVIGLIAMIARLQSVYRESDAEHDNDLDYAGSLQDLIDVKFVSRSVVEASGYTITICTGKAAPEFLWMLVAAPTRPGITGRRYFVASHAGQTYASTKPIALDPIKCKIPKGLEPLGK